jgi:hypothetical protein
MRGASAGYCPPVQSAIETEAGAMVLRATYFTERRGGPRGGAWERRWVHLYEVERALGQVRELLDVAPFVQSRIERSAPLPTLRSLEMRSPLQLVLQLDPEYVGIAGFGLLLIAERLCTFGPRVSRRRQEEFLKAEGLQTERDRLRRLSEAEALAWDLSRKGPRATPSTPRGPDTLDFLLPGEDEDDLVPLRSRSE